MQNFQYFSEIAQNPESNRPGPGGASMAASKPPWPASVCSSSSRESSPFSSKTSDSTRDSVYGHNREYRRNDRFTPQPQSRQGAVEDAENIYATIGPPSTNKPDRLFTAPAPPTPPHSPTEHIYAAVPAIAGSSATLSSASETTENTATALSRESLDSDSSVQAGFVKEKQEEEAQSSILAKFRSQLNEIKQECDVVKLPPEPPKPESPSQAAILAGYASQLSKIRRDCQVKEEFMKNTTIPAYMSSPPKEMDRSPYRIASLASTMPPRKEDVLPPKKEPTPGEISFRVWFLSFPLLSFRATETSGKELLHGHLRARGEQDEIGVHLGAGVEEEKL